MKPDEEKLKLGLKQSFLVDADDAEEKAEESLAVPDIDAEMLDAVEADSDDGDWRNAMNDSAASEEEEQGITWQAQFESMLW